MNERIKVCSYRFAEAMIYDHCLFDNLIAIECDKRCKRNWLFQKTDVVQKACDTEYANIKAANENKQEILNKGIVNNIEY